MFISASFTSRGPILLVSSAPSLFLCISQLKEIKVALIVRDYDSSSWALIAFQIESPGARGWERPIRKIMTPSGKDPLPHLVQPTAVNSSPGDFPDFRHVCHIYVTNVSTLTIFSFKTFNKK